MKNKKYFMPVLCLSVLLISGCGANANTNSNSSQNTNQPQQQSNQTPQRITNENFSQGSLADLEIGKKVMVMGKQNTDGTIVASQVIVANSDVDFSQLGPNRNQQQKNSADPSQFQNLTEEERAQLRAQRGGGQNLTDEQKAQFRTQMGGKSNGKRQMNRSMAHLNGEITAKDDTSITLKLKDGSAKLVFVSDATIVDIIKPAN
ncbi:MAG: hypothetical protein V1688_03560 [bacterium]